MENQDQVQTTNETSIETSEMPETVNENKSENKSYDKVNEKLKLVYASLKDKKEKKLKYDYKKIEEIVENFLVEHDLDFEIETYIYEELSSVLDKDVVFNNLDVLLGNKPENEYQIQLTIEQFVKIDKHIKNLIYEKIDKELKRKEENNEFLSEEDKLMYHEIYKNLTDDIELTMFDEGVNKLTLVSFHYYLKVLEEFAKMYLAEKEVTNIKRAKNPLELFLKDLYSILGRQAELTRFLLTLKSLIEQWLVKYNSKTKIGEFYYDILMITPDQIIERVLKYLMFTAIKNKNPMTLRAIFSSYLTLIHQNLFSFYATNLSKVKVGFFKQLENLFTENFNLVFDDSNELNTNTFIIDSMLVVFLNKHKRFLKDDYFSVYNDEFIQSFFEPNYFDFMRAYNKDQINFLDHSFLYNTITKFTKNSFTKESYYHKLNHKFFKNNSKKKNFNIIKEYLNLEMFNYFYEIIGDSAAVDDILNAIAKDLSIKLNFNLFVDDDFNTIDQNKVDLERQLSSFVTIMKNKLVK